MKKPDDIWEISSQEIKEIRHLLNLTRAEAGEMLGGGPSAFAKYENGSVKPSAALVKMLRFLQKRPEELAAISGRESQATKPGSSPFDVTSEHISALDPCDFSALVEKLLSAEAQEWNLPLDGIHVASRVTAPDGGEDARIEWQGGLGRTDFLPNRFCQFQLKTGDISPKEAGEEVLTRENKLKPMVREALKKRASYIMLCSRPYAQKLIDKRRDSIKRNLENHGFKDPSVQFRDSGQITSWVNYHPCVAVWLLRKTCSDLVNPFFGNWKHWSERPKHHDSPRVDDSRLPKFRRKLRTIVMVPKGVARIIGTGGIGKSRLVLEALGPTETEKTSGVKLSDLVLYAVESEAGSHKIKEYAWNLANSGKRAVLVIDRCLEETRVDITNIAKHSDSRLSLVTISSEVPRDAEEFENTILVENAGYSLVEKIVELVDPNIPEWDRRRIVEFSEGDIRCARIIAGTWHEKGLTASVGEEPLLRELIGYDGFEPVYEAAGLISVFGGVGTEVVDDAQLEFEQFSGWLFDSEQETAREMERETEPVGDKESELEQVARFAVDFSVADFRRAVEKLKRREAVRQYGDRLILEPKRRAVEMAEHQWKEWGTEQWEEVLLGPIHEQLRIRAAEQLALLNMKEIAREIAGHVCGNRDFWSSPEKLARNSVILSSLADANPEKVVSLLEDVLDSLSSSDIQSISDDASSNLADALSKIAFVEGTFESVAGALLKLACGEDEIINDEAERQFISLFPAQLANTADGPEKRLRAIDGFLERYGEGSSVHMSLVVSALLEGAKIKGFHRGVGQEIHGGRPSRESWEPGSDEEFWDYVKQCVSRLVKLAKRPDEIGEQARGGLGHCWRTYVLGGLIGDVEKWTREIKKENQYWPEALRSFHILLKHDGGKLEGSIRQKIKHLVTLLEPDDLEDRVQLLIKGIPRDRSEDLEHLTVELLGREGRLKELVSELCGGWYSGTQLFGRVLAERASDPLYWKQQAMEAFESIAGDEREPGFLIGYIKGLEKRSPEKFRNFKLEASESPVFAPLLPRLTSYSGIGSEDVDIVIKALRAGLIPPEEMSGWIYEESLSELPVGDAASLFDTLLKSEDSPFFGVALDLIRSYADEKKELLECLRPQLRLAAGYPSIGKERMIDELSHMHSYETLMTWIISKGSEDADARAVAIVIIKQLSVHSFSFNDEQAVRRLLPAILSNFAEIVWPLIGQAIQENPAKAGWFSMLLREGSVFGDQPAPILSIPENTLFGWCYANPKIGPEFLARAVPALKENGQEAAPAEFHPIIKRLLDEFGQEEDLLKGLKESIITSTWSGPLEIYFVRYKEPMRGLREHEKEAVRRWARKMLDYIDNAVNQIRKNYKGRGII